MFDGSNVINHVKAGLRRPRGDTISGCGKLLRGKENAWRKEERQLIAMSHMAGAPFSARSPEASFKTCTVSKGVGGAALHLRALLGCK